jgi:ABC-2 type transport system permease protein
MNATIARLTWRSLLGRRRAALLLVLPAILIVLAITLRLIQGQEAERAVTLLSAFGAGFLVPLLGLIAGTGAIGPEVDDGSIIYVLAKPLSRYSIVVTKVVVAIVVVIGFGAIPILVAGLILAGGTAGVAVGFAVGAVVAGIAYSALFLLLAVVTRNAVVAGLLYALIWESAVGNFVPGAKALSVQQWGLAVTEKVIGSRADELGATSAVDFGTGAVLLVVLTIGATLYAGYRLRSIRLTGEE